MEYAVTAPARFRLSGSRAAAIGPVVAGYLLVFVMTAGFVGVAWWVLRPAVATLLPAIALGVLPAGLAARTAARWRTAPSVLVGRSGIVVEHPDLREPLVVPVADVADVVLMPETAPGGRWDPRFPVVDGRGAVVGWLYRRGTSRSLTMFDTTPRHQPTVAVVFRVPRALPVRPLSVMRGPFSAYPVNDSYGLLLSVRDLAGVRAAFEQAGLRPVMALPQERATGLRAFPPE
ncbi:MAG TPA: hypothetical protein VNA20_07995 [Frankiaceae bacterium]|nr:hypothetical protein [Frankiaceae bacterium]